MIQILKYGEVPNSRIFARVALKADVSAIVAEILVYVDSMERIQSKISKD